MNEQNEMNKIVGETEDGRVKECHLKIKFCIAYTYFEVSTSPKKIGSDLKNWILKISKLLNESADTICNYKEEFDRKYIPLELRTPGNNIEELIVEITE